jgi:multimeric flavodoxin WrbA
MKKVFGIVGSPRHGKNTASLVGAVLEGAAGAGLETEMLYLNDYDLVPCQGCDACQRTREGCIQEDEMGIFYHAIDEEGILVLGTPIYFEHVSAQLKIFLDRLYAYWGEGDEMLFPKGIKAVLAATWADEGADLYDEVMEWLRVRFANIFAVETVAVLTAAKTGDHPVMERPGLLKRARAVGEGLVKYA